LHIDAEIWAGTTAKQFPTLFSLPPYTRVQPIADTRPVETIPGNYAPDHEIKKGKLYINGEQYGRECRFSSLLKEQDINLDFLRVPAWKVMRITKDYYCTHRKRKFLKDGCVYGTPLYLMQMEYKKTKRIPGRLLAKIIYESAKYPAVSEKTFKKHVNMLDACKGKVKIHYYTHTQSISINEEHFASGAPARILKRIISSHLMTGQKHYDRNIMIIMSL